MRGMTSAQEVSKCRSSFNESLNELTHKVFKWASNHENVQSSLRRNCRSRFVPEEMVNLSLTARPLHVQSGYKVDKIDKILMKVLHAIYLNNILAELRLSKHWENQTSRNYAYATSGSHRCRLILYILEALIF